MRFLGQVVRLFLHKVSGKKSQQLDATCFPLRQDLIELDLTFARARFNSGEHLIWNALTIPKCFHHTKKNKNTKGREPELFNVKCIAGELGYLSEKQALIIPGNYHVILGIQMYRRCSGLP